MRVIDLSYVFAVPYMGALLADFGAEVVKLEAPHRLDQTRVGFGPLVDNDPGDEPWNRNATFQSLNRGKQSISVDLSTEAGREILLRLVADADVVLDNFTPRVMRGWGLGPDRLLEVNPRLIVLSNTGYGSTGPWAEYRAQGTTLEATMGVTRHTGYPGGAPMKVGQSYPDFIACWTGLMSIGAALVHRERTGQGQWIDLGMYQLGPAVVPEALLEHQLTGHEPELRGAQDCDARSGGVFRVAEPDTWIAVSVRDDTDLARLRSLIPDLGDDVEQGLERWARGRDRDAAVAALRSVGVPAGPVLDAPGLLADPQMTARGFYEKVDLGDGEGPRAVIGRPYTWAPAERGPRVAGPAPRFGQHNDEVLAGLDGVDLAALRRDGVVADAPRSTPSLEAMDFESMVRTGLLRAVDPNHRSAVERALACRTGAGWEKQGRRSA